MAKPCSNRVPALSLAVEKFYHHEKLCPFLFFQCLYAYSHQDGYNEKNIVVGEFRGHG